MSQNFPFRIYSLHEVFRTKIRRKRQLTSSTPQTVPQKGDELGDLFSCLIL